MSRLLTSRQLVSRRPTLFAPNGKVISQHLYPSPRSNPKLHRPRQTLRPTTRENVTETDRLELVNYSRQLYAQVGDLKTAVDQKNSWAFGDAWDAHFVGKNTKWGEEAEEFLRYQFYPVCNLRGPLFHFRRTLEISGRAMDRDGDDLLIFTESESHFPMIAVFPTTMIRTHSMGAGYGRAEEVMHGDYKGLRIFDGIIYNRNNRAVAVRVWGDDNKSTDYSLFSADLAFEPEWSDQGRGIPRPSTCLLRWLNMEDINHFLQAGMKRAATMQINRFTADGESTLTPNTVADEEEVLLPDGTTETREIHIEQVGDGGDIYELSSADGEEIKILDYKNPHPNAEAFLERLKRECLTSVGWFYELLNLESTGRAPSRMVCDLANQSIWARQDTGYRRAKRIIGYAVAKAMKHGFISRNDDGADAYQWEFGLPKVLSVDAGNDEQAARENLKMGLTSRKIEAQKKGYRAEEIEGDREKELMRLCARARRIMQGNPEVTFDKAMELLEQRSPNPIMQPLAKTSPQNQQTQNQSQKTE